MKKKRPELRFYDFDNDWEQRKLSQLMKTHRGLTYKPTDICENGVRVLRSSNIEKDAFITREDDVFVNPDAVNISMAHRGDILITSANGSLKLVGKHAIIQYLPEKYAVHGGFMLLGTADNPYFVNALLGTSWYQEFISIYVAGGNGAIGNLNKGDLDEQIILAPSESEQKRIGAYFKNLDHLITLHQRKLKKLQNIRISARARALCVA